MKNSRTLSKHRLSNINVDAQMKHDSRDDVVDLNPFFIWQILNVNINHQTGVAMLSIDSQMYDFDVYVTMQTKKQEFMKVGFVELSKHVNSISHFSGVGHPKLTSYSK